MGSPSFYSDRVNGAVPRVHEDLPFATSTGLEALVSRRINNNYLAEEFPSWCGDGYGIEGTDFSSIQPELLALVPEATWPLWENFHSDATLFDVSSLSDRNSPSLRTGNTTRI